MPKEETIYNLELVLIALRNEKRIKRFFPQYDRIADISPTTYGVIPNKGGMFFVSKFSDLQRFFT